MSDGNEHVDWRRVEVTAEPTKDDRWLYTSPNGARMVTANQPDDAWFEEAEDGGLVMLRVCLPI